MKPTLNSLGAEIKKLTEELATTKQRSGQYYSEREAARTAEKSTREQFADLKKRLHDAELHVERLQGYIARVQEDDVVREELLTVGDPEGEQRIVAKRKHKYLGNKETEYTNFGDEGAMTGYRDRSREKPKHWIEY